MHFRRSSAGANVMATGACNGLDGSNAGFTQSGDQRDNAAITSRFICQRNPGAAGLFSRVIRPGSGLPAFRQPVSGRYHHRKMGFGRPVFGGSRSTYSVCFGPSGENPQSPYRQNFAVFQQTTAAGQSIIKAGGNLLLRIRQPDMRSAIRHRYSASHGGDLPGHGIHADTPDKTEKPTSRYSDDHTAFP